MPGLLSLGSILSGGTLLSNVSKRKADAVIVELDNTGAVTGDFTAFQYWPETVSDTKAVNWVPREIPGGSLPVYQWVSSGERAISFTAIFTSDIDLYDPDNIKNNAFLKLQNAGQSRRNVDIRSALVWLRRFMLPSYGSPGTIGVPNTFAPRFAKLLMQGSAIGLTGGETSHTNATSQTDSIIGLMNQCDITYQASFPSGFPRIVEVQLTFLQVPQFGGQGVEFPQFKTDPSGSMTQAFKGDGKNFFGYTLKGHDSKVQTE